MTSSEVIMIAVLALTFAADVVLVVLARDILRALQAQHTVSGWHVLPERCTHEDRPVHAVHVSGAMQRCRECHEGDT